MLPFPKQNHMQGGSDPSPNQFPGSSSALPNQFGLQNPQIMTAAMGGFNNQNALFSSLLAQQHLMQGLQNNLIGALLQQGIIPQLHGQQLNLLGSLQNPNFMPTQQGGPLGGPSLGQNLNQMMGFSPNGLLYSQNPIFLPNSQLPVINSGNSNFGLLGNGNTQVGQSSCGLRGHETQISSHKLQEPILPSPLQSIQLNGCNPLQMTNGQATGQHFSSNLSEFVAHKNFKPKFNELGKRERSHMRFQKFQCNNSRNDWQKKKRFPRNDHEQHQNKVRKTNFSEKCDNSTLRKRNLTVIYSESEVQQWREARKRNFPTRNNIEKRLCSNYAKNEDRNSDAKICRQQLKEVLAKQAELGFEVAEIPSIYLTEPEDQTSKNVNAGEGSNKEVRTPFNHFKNKRGRLRHASRNAKRLKLKNKAAPAHEPVVKKREPTLLRKLLNADIRRDKSQLLQAFRFIILNSFFRDDSGNPLVFPAVTAKGVPEPEMVVEKNSPLNKGDFIGKNGNAEENKAVKSECDVENDTDGASDVECEPMDESFGVHCGDKSEEGEITD